MKFLLTAVAALGIGGWCSAGAEVGPPVPEIGTSELAELIKTEPRLVLIDVRTPEEVLLRDGMIDATQSYNIPRGWLEFRIRETVLDPTTPIVVYCGRNERSPLAAATLREMGYTNVRNYAAGIFAWREAGLPRWIMDKALDTPLYERPRKIAEGVYSAIGATQPPSYENAGHNNNLSFVIGSEAVLVVNAGDNDALARALHAEIRQITDLPVRYVALENAQVTRCWARVTGRIRARRSSRIAMRRPRSTSTARRFSRGCGRAGVTMRSARVWSSPMSPSTRFCRSSLATSVWNCVTSARRTVRATSSSGCRRTGS